MSFINSKKKRDIINPNIIYVNNFQYNHNKTYLKSPFNKYYVWRKVTLDLKCKASLTVDTECKTIVIEAVNHNHAPIKELDLRDVLRENRAITKIDFKNLPF